MRSRIWCRPCHDGARRGHIAQAVKVATRARAAQAAQARGALATLTLAALLGCSPASDEPEHPGEAVYLRYCFSCHQAGRDGAPKLGDQDAWQPRIAQGRDAMLNNVKRGMAPGMPPRGACASCDDETLAVALDYMIASGND